MLLTHTQLYFTQCVLFKKWFYITQFISQTVDTNLKMGDMYFLLQLRLTELYTDTYLRLLLFTIFGIFDIMSAKNILQSITLQNEDMQI